MLLLKKQQEKLTGEGFELARKQVNLINNEMLIRTVPEDETAIDELSIDAVDKWQDKKQQALDLIQKELAKIKEVDWPNLSKREKQLYLIERILYIVIVLTLGTSSTFLLEVFEYINIW